MGQMADYERQLLTIPAPVKSFLKGCANGAVEVVSKCLQQYASVVPGGQTAVKAIEAEVHKRINACRRRRLVRRDNVVTHKICVAAIPMGCSAFQKLVVAGVTAAAPSIPVVITNCLSAPIADVCTKYLTKTCPKRRFI